MGLREKRRGPKVRSAGFDAPGSSVEGGEAEKKNRRRDMVGKGGAESVLVIGKPRRGGKGVEIGWKKGSQRTEERGGRE